MAILFLVLLAGVMAGVVAWRHFGSVSRGSPPLERNAPPTPELEALLAQMASDAQPRFRHYQFAHRLLPAVSAQLATDANPQRAIDALWNQSPDPTRAVYSGAPTARVIDGGVLVTMPAPLGSAEAFLVAAMRVGAGARCFTLEKSFRNFVLCEWADGAHRNFGECEGSEAAFLAAVRTKLS